MVNVQELSSSTNPFRVPAPNGARNKCFVCSFLNDLHVRLTWRTGEGNGLLEEVDIQVIFEFNMETNSM